MRTIELRVQELMGAQFHINIECRSMDRPGRGDVHAIMTYAFQEDQALEN